MSEAKVTSLTRRAFLRVAGLGAAGIAAIPRLFGRASAGEAQCVATERAVSDKQGETPAPPPRPRPQGELARPRFTARARRLIVYAQEEASQLKAEKVGPEHLLLALVRQPDSGGAETLQRLGVPLPRVREEILQQITPGTGSPALNVPLAPRAKRVLDGAYEEARALQHRSVGSEHMLLGLLRQKEGLAVAVMERRGVELDRARREVIAVRRGREDDKTGRG